MINEEPVVFDKYGQWQHSAIDNAPEEYHERPVIELPGFEDMKIRIVDVWDVLGEEAADRYHAEGQPFDFREWRPETPEGFFPIGFYETEDGPFAAFAAIKEKA